MAIPSSNNDYNTAIGFSSLDQLLIGNYNCFVGVKADASFGHTTGSYNVHIGGTVGANNVNYSDNVIISGDASNIRPSPGAVSVIGNTVVGNTNDFYNTSAPVTIIGYNNNNTGGLGNYANITDVGANNVLIGSTIINIGNSNTINFDNCIVIGNAQTPAAANSIVIGDASHTSVIVGGVTLSSPTGSVFPSAIIGDAGTEGTGIVIGGVTYDALLKVSDIASTDIAQAIIHRHSTTWEPIQVFARSNSNGSGHGAVINGMIISSQYSAGWTGTEYNLFGRTGFEAAAAGTISDASSPGDYVIATTPDGGTLPVEAMRIKSDKSIAFNGVLGTTGKVLTSTTGGAPVWGTFGASSYPAPLAGYEMITPGVYMVTNGNCIITGGFNGAADGVLRDQDITLMTKVGAAKPPAGATYIIAEIDCKIIASGAAGTHEFNAVFYRDQAGTIVGPDPAFATMERAGDVAGVDWIGGGQQIIYIPMSNPAARIFTTKFDDSHAAPKNSYAQGLHIMGYVMPPL